MGKTIRSVALALFAALPLTPLSGDAEDKRQLKHAPTLPPMLEDIHGRSVDLRKLAKRNQLIFVTLKATWCAVCERQLVRLRKLQPRLKDCGATFVVLSPGPRKTLMEIAQRTDFRFPFVEDVDLDIAGALDLRLAADQIVPAMFAVDHRGRVTWMQRGRAPGLYGDDGLLNLLDCGTDGSFKVRHPPSRPAPWLASARPLPPRSDR